MRINKAIAVASLVFITSPVFAAGANGQGAVNGNSGTSAASTVSNTTSTGSAATTSNNTTTTATDTATTTTTNGNGNGAANGSGSGTTSSTSTQSQNENQVRTQTQTQTNNPGTGMLTQTQTQTEEQLRIDNEIKASKPTYTAKNAKAETQRSVVANAAEALIRVAEKTENQGIGAQIKTIAQTQSKNQDKIGQAIDKTETRTGFAKFFIGANYEQLKTVKNTMEQNRTQIKELEQAMTQLTADADKVEVANQIILLQNQQIELRDQVSDLSSGFSLFGWVARWHNHF